MAGDAWENRILISFLLVWYKRTHLDCLLLPQVKRWSLLWTCRSKSWISLIYLQGLVQWGLRKTVPWCFLRSTLNHSRQSHQEWPLLSEKELVIRMGEKDNGGGGGDGCCGKQTGCFKAFLHQTHPSAVTSHGELTAPRQRGQWPSRIHDLNNY